jgi:two-component system phosphate regulon sensor histidine kinase PhoR
VNTDLRTLVEKIGAGVHDRAQEKQLTLELDLEQLPESLPLDPDLISQALVNLVDNAIKYTPEHGRVRIRGSKLDSDLRLTVENTGPGILREHHGRIFERFYRVDPARSRQVGGTGLGLAIVKHCAAVHGGAVVLESEPGELTTFEIVLPVQVPVN